MLSIASATSMMIELIPGPEDYQDPTQYRRQDKQANLTRPLPDYTEPVATLSYVIQPCHIHAALLHNIHSTILPCVLHERAAAMTTWAHRSTRTP